MKRTITKMTGNWFNLFFMGLDGLLYAKNDLVITRVRHGLCLYTPLYCICMYIRTYLEYRFARDFVLLAST